MCSNEKRVVKSSAASSECVGELVHAIDNVEAASREAEAVRELD